MTTQQEDDLRSRTPTQWEQAGMDWWNAKTDGERGAMLSSPLVSEKSDRWMTSEMSPARCYEVFAGSPQIARHVFNWCVQCDLPVGVGSCGECIHRTRGEP